MKRYTTREAAPLLGLSQDTVQRYCKTGTLRAERHDTPRGPAWMITQAEINRYNRERRKRGQPRKVKR